MNGHQVCTLAVIEKEKPGKTGYFVDGRLVKSAPHMVKHTLDWILENQWPLQAGYLKFDGYDLEERYQNKELPSRRICIYSDGDIFIGY